MAHDWNELANSQLPTNTEEEGQTVVVVASPEETLDKEGIIGLEGCEGVFSSQSVQLAR